MEKERCRDPEGIFLFDLGKKSMRRFLDCHKENLQICLVLHEVTIKT